MAKALASNSDLSLSPDPHAGRRTGSAKLSSEVICALCCVHVHTLRNTQTRMLVLIVSFLSLVKIVSYYPSLSACDVLSVHLLPNNKCDCPSLCNTNPYNINKLSSYEHATSLDRTPIYSRAYIKRAGVESWVSQTQRVQTLRAFQNVR